ncbi:MAG: hypothetical protein ACU0DW_11100 [Shimia sp.]
MPFRTPAFALTLAACGGAASAQEAPSLADIFNPDALIARMLQSLVISARTVSDVRFDGITSRGAGERITLTGLDVWMIEPYASPDCNFGAERVQIVSSGWDEIESLSFRLNGIGAYATAACFGDDALPVLEQIELEEIPLDHLTLALEYHIPSAGADITLTAAAPDLAQVEAQVKMDYFSIEAGDNPDPVPVIFLESARVSVDDAGLWAKVRPLLPPDATSPIIGPMLAQGLSGAILEEGPAQLSEAETALATSLGETVTAFLSNGGTVIATLTPDEPEYIPVEYFDGDIPVREAIEIFKPSIGQAALRQAAILTPEGFAALSPSEQIMAALEGRGVPRNLDAAIEASSRASMDGAEVSPDAQLALASAITDITPDAAYSIARALAATGRTEASAIMDAVEAELTFAEILALQGDSGGAPANGASDLREDALAALTGTNAPRNYAAAYRLALLAQASGDLGADAILADLETSFSGAPNWLGFTRMQGQMANRLWSDGISQALAGDR